MKMKRAKEERDFANVDDLLMSGSDSDQENMDEIGENMDEIGENMDEIGEEEEGRRGVLSYSSSKYLVPRYGTCNKRMHKTRGVGWTCEGRETEEKGKGNPSTPPFHGPPGDLNKSCARTPRDLIGTVPVYFLF